VALGVENAMGVWGLGKAMVALLAAMFVGWLKEEEKSTSLM